MRREVGLILVCTALVLIAALALAGVSSYLPAPLGLTLIILPSVIGAVTAGLAWHRSLHNHGDMTQLHTAVASLSESVNIRLTQILVLTADEQRALGKAEGIAQALPSADQAALVAAQAATSAAEVAQRLVEVAADQARILLQSAEHAADFVAQAQSINSREQVAVVAENTGEIARNTDEVARNTAATAELAVRLHV